MLDKIKEFGPSSWAIDNKMSIYVLTVIMAVTGCLSFINRPKEQFPEVVFPQILVNTIYPGTSPKDMENLVSKQLEKQVKSIVGVKKVTSNSIQDFSSVSIEFNTDINTADAKQKVKDAVDKAKTDLPKDLLQAPSVIEIDLTQVPIMNVNLSGDYDLDRLKKYADKIKEQIEGLKQITRVDVVGALDREVQVNVDMYKAAAATVSIMDIENAVKYENMTISGGAVSMDNVKRTIQVNGQFKTADQLNNIVIKGGTGATVYLKDIAEIKDTYKEQESYARLDGKNVITLNIIKRSGENLIEASDNIQAICKDAEVNMLPKGMKVTITGDQSVNTRVTLHDLINTIIIGFALVTLILMFFMGATNAFFVALSVPLSTFLAFLLMPWLGDFFHFKFTLNMIVLFALLLALGIVVDDAIVVIENTHRLKTKYKMPIIKAAKLGAGEVFIPVLTGTITTLAPFIPLLFWEGVFGKFMFFLPATLIVILVASLVVAYIMNPVFAVDFMQDHGYDENEPRISRGFKVTSVVFFGVILMSYLIGGFGLGNLALTAYAFYCLHRFVLEKLIDRFQNSFWPKVQNAYANLLGFILKGKRAIFVLIAMVLLFVSSIVILGKYPPNVVFFPKADPNFVFTYIKLPIGTDQAYTNQVTKDVEAKVMKVIGQNNRMVNSIISNVAVGAQEAGSFDVSAASHLGKVTVAFVPFEERHGESTVAYLDKIRNEVKDIPGAQITVEQEAGGPPVPKPISIEIIGEEFEDLSSASQELIRYLNQKQIPGVESLKSDLVTSKPELEVTVNRERAQREGISTAQIGSEIRNAVFGKEISKLKQNNDEYPIQLRFKEDQRNNINALMNTTLSFRDMAMGGMMRQVPLSAVAEVKYTTTYGGIKRKNQKRVVTVSSNVLSGFNPNNVVAEVQTAVRDFNKPNNVEVSFGGEQEEQKNAASFLGRALLISIGLMFFVLVLQFNSVSKPFIILSEIFFSITGVFLGFVIFRMDISIMMTGIGIVALGGIIVRNGILLVEFIELMIDQGMPVREAIIEAGRTRMTPVLLTAAGTVLGLIPLAVGLNIDFVKLFSELNPHIFFGGDSVAFWGPLSWTMIFGLIFGTVITLLLVPSLYLIVDKFKERIGYSSASAIKQKNQVIQEEVLDVDNAELA